MILAGNFWDAVLDFLTNEGWNIVLVLSIIVIAFVGIKIIASILTKILYRSKVDGSAIAFYVAVLKVILWILTVFAVASVLSIPTSSLVVGLSSVALAIALALKDSLANLANGILIIYNKPFRRGDYIEIDGIDGVIKNIKLLTTELLTYDNRRIVLPNSKVVGGTIINNTAMPTRRITFNFAVSYDSNPSLVEKVLREAFEKNHLVNKNPKVYVFLSAHGTSSLTFTVRCWTDTEDYWDVYNGMPRKVYDAFIRNDIVVPYNQLDVYLKPHSRLDIEYLNEEKSAYKPENTGNPILDTSETNGGNKHENH